MSRLVWLVTACALAAAAPSGFADEVKPVKQPGPLADRLKEKVVLDGNKLGDQPLFEVLAQLSKRHAIAFVILEEEFKAAGARDIKDHKSRIKNLDTTDLTVAGFLDAWLPAAGAAYAVRADYVELAPARRADAAPPAKRGDPVERLLAALEQDAPLKEGQNLNELPLFELLSYLSKQHQIPFVVNEEAFKQSGDPNFKDQKPRFAATAVRDATLRQLLALTLDSIGATYLLRNGAIEIVPVAYAAKVTKAPREEGEDGRARLKEPLVSAVFRDKPLNEAVARIAEMYDLTVVVAPQAADARTGFVNVRLLNVPADKAIELLALQCDLRVVRKGTAYMLTNKDQADGLFNEKLDRERQKIEVEKLRDAPAAPPAPPAPPPAPPAPTPTAPKM